ncbi:cobyrinic acid a,c-diamide synthase [Desulfitispora alkaliphila]|uniref:cobyrinate a,c-diamide synthase n=1 Tax=Desulfitispora alkaliphila TaxID=622674 RepID=UPI003D223B97
MATPKIPRIVIAAPKGRSGKTTFTLGLLSALTSKGKKVQSFKKGPDYIDPSWMSAITGRDCCNLDSVMMTDEMITESFIENSKNADIGIVEGAMGLYDGFDLEGSGSTAQIAKVLKAPVILVVDCTRMTRSAAATVMGYQHFDRDINIGGIILNKVGRARHERMLRNAIEKYCQVPVIGSIPQNANLTIPDRHLGLIPANETDIANRTIENIGQVVSDNVDLVKLQEIAESAPALTSYPEAYPRKITKLGREEVSIGIIRDRAFSFYYPENLRMLENSGAKLVQLDSLSDREIGDVNGLFIGGGFPEIFASDIEANSSFRKSILEAIEKGLPVYAECGGLMYLGRKIIQQDKDYKMVGALPFDVVMEKKPQGHGYTQMRVTKENPYFPEAHVFKGHEFHNSRLINLDNSKVEFALKVERGNGVDGANDGIIYKNVLAAYNHIHGLSNPQWAHRFVSKAFQYKTEKQGKS